MTQWKKLSRIHNYEGIYLCIMKKFLSSWPAIHANWSACRALMVWPLANNNLNMIQCNKHSVLLRNTSDLIALGGQATRGELQKTTTVCLPRRFISTPTLVLQFDGEWINRSADWFEPSDGVNSILSSSSPFHDTNADLNASSDEIFCLPKSNWTEPNSSLADSRYESSHKRNRRRSGQVARGPEAAKKVPTELAGRAI